MDDLKDDITVTRVESYVENTAEQLFIKLDESTGFKNGESVIVLRYQDFAHLADVSTVSELRRKLESYTNSFMRVKELKMKLESAETYYKEQLSELNNQIATLTKRII